MCRWYYIGVSNTYGGAQGMVYLLHPGPAIAVGGAFVVLFTIPTSAEMWIARNTLYAVR